MGPVTPTPSHQAGSNTRRSENYAVVARRFPLSRRRDTLSFGHRTELCALTDSEQDRWLDLAEGHGWARTALRREVRGARAQPALPVPTSMRLSLDAARLDRCRRAASEYGAELQEWVIRTLDEAVGSPLSDGP